MNAVYRERGRPLAFGVLANYVSLVYTKKGVVTITKIDPKCEKSRCVLKQNALYRKLCAKAAQV